MDKMKEKKWGAKIGLGWVQDGDTRFTVVMVVVVGDKWSVSAKRAVAA